MKRIVFYFNSMQPSGGIERVIATLANKLSVNYDITILVKDRPLSFYALAENVKIDTLNNELVLNMNSRISRVFKVAETILSTGKLLRRYFEGNKFDYFYVAHPLNVLEFYLAGVEPHKIVISEHAAKVHYNKVYRFIKKLLYKRCHKYIVPTKTDTALYLKENFPAVNIPHFRSEIPYSMSEKKGKTVLNIGRFTPDKQQLSLLSIWLRVMQENSFPDWMLLLAGSGELEDQLRAFVQNNKLEKNVLFLPPNSHIEEYYLKASIFALTSRSEGYGMVLLEAISFGLPCVSFDCPSGPRDIIIDRQNGFLIDLNNEEKFKQGLIKLMSDQDLINKMGNNAMESSLNWSDDVILNKWFSILN